MSNNIQKTKYPEMALTAILSLALFTYSIAILVLYA